jgi:hypothetical protein
VAAIESWYLISGQGNNNTLDLSEQELLSCVYSTGCNGGNTPTVGAPRGNLGRRAAGEDLAELLSCVSATGCNGGTMPRCASTRS